MPPLPVEVAEVRARAVRDEFRAVGTIEADENIQVVSELNAVVRALPFTEGQHVAAGALLAQLDDREFRAEAERAEAERRQAASNHERSQKLAEQHLISPRELDDARAALDVAEANAALASARLDKTRIRAPFDGVVGTRLVSPGAYLKSGDAITNLARLAVLKVTFTAPERLMGTLNPGVPVSVSVPAFPGETFIGHVTVVDPILDPDTRTIRLLARIPNGAGRLRPGMSANVSVALAERPRALVVPDEAVFAEGDQSFVYVVNGDSTVTRAPIVLGSRDSMRVEVVRGLASGQRVVRAGYQKLFEGARVMPIAEGPPGPGGAGGDPR